MEPETVQYMVRLEGTRASWPENMTDDEERIMSEHFEYLKDLVRRNKVMIAGPVFEPVFGLIILNVTSAEEANQIMDIEPSVLQGVHTYTISPMRLSLMAHNVPEERYVGDPSGKTLQKEITVDATVAEVWEKWTTESGLQSFFAPNVNMQLDVGGPFEILFSMESPPGMRGSEGCKVLSYLPQQMLSFEWNAPPSFGQLRYTYTRVVIFFDKVEPGRVQLRLTHLGWGKGAEWDKLYNYFDSAWDSVLDSFAESVSGN